MDEYKWSIEEVPEEDVDPYVCPDCGSEWDGDVCEDCGYGEW